MIAIVCAVFVGLIVAFIALAAIMGWGARVTRCQRIGLLICASGLVLAAPSRLLAKPIGLADLMFVAGLLIYLVARHLKFILHHADELDGAVDGRFALPPTAELIARIKAVGGKGPSQRR